MTLLYKAEEVSRLAGFKKPWMLGHLVREGIFVRSEVQDREHGNRRKYTFSDLLILRTINRMLALGMRPVKIKNVLSKLGLIEGLSGNRETLEHLVRTLGVRLFVTGDQAYLVKNEEEIISLRDEGQLAFAFMIDLKTCLGGVVSIARRYEAARTGNLKLDLPVLDKMCSSAGL